MKNESETVQNLSNSEKMWNQIQNLKIDMFALPNQFVSNYCKFVNIDSEKLYLTVSPSSALPALEAALVQAYGPDKFDISMTEKFVVLTPINKIQVK